MELVHSQVRENRLSIFLEEGDVFSIGIRNGTGVGVRGSTGDDYALGSLYIGGDFFVGGGSFTRPDNDLNFRTTVAPVPLPAGLPLLMIGLGSLALLRRKQNV